MGQEIKSSGARFVKIDDKTQQWYELNDVRVHQKIGHAIRDTIRMLKDKPKYAKHANTKSNTSKRKRDPRPSITPEEIQSSLDKIQKKMEKFIQENNTKSSRHDERNTSIGPLFLKNEYPE